MPHAHQSEAPLDALTSVAIFLRVVWLPAWAGLALVWLGIPEPIALFASVPLLIAEVPSFRRRWTRRVLRGLVPADPAMVPGDSEGDARHIARTYGAALVGFGLIVAAWLAFSGVTVNVGLGVGRIVCGIVGAAAIYVGFEYLIRSRFGTNYRYVGMTRNVLEGAGDGAFVFVLPRSARLVGSTIIIVATGFVLSAMSMHAAVASDWIPGPLDPGVLAFSFGVTSVIQAAVAVGWTSLESGLAAPMFDDEEMQRREDLAEQARQKNAPQHL